MPKFRVNDIILCYYKGLWKIVGIEKRKDINPLVWVVKVATHRMMPCKPMRKVCDMAWCKYPLDTTIEYAKANGVII
jgi:hypothetical protein